MSCEKFKLILFTIYSIVFELMVWGGFYLMVVVNEMSGYWVIAAFILSGSQLMPKHFGLNYLKDNDNV